MSNVLFLDNGFYRLINDSEVIRGSDNYQIIRDEVNRRFNPLAGAPIGKRCLRAVKR